MDNILPYYEVKELPSRFLGYPAGTKIFISPYTFGAAMNIEMVGRNSLNAIEETLEGVKVEGLPKNMLTPQDILFLGVYRNLVSSKHDKISIKSICPKCLKENEEVQTLKTLKFKELDGFDAECYPIEVDFDNYKMWFGFVTYKDFKFCVQKYRGHKLFQLALQVLKYEDKSTGELIEKPNYTLGSKDAKATLLIEKYVTEVRDILRQFVDEDKDALDEVVDILEDYGMKSIETTCKDELCKHTYSFGLEEEGVLVTPFRDSTKSARTRIKLRTSDIDKSDSVETDEPERSGNATRPVNEEKEPIKPKPKAIKQIEYFDKE